VAGAAALLNAYQETIKHRETSPYAMRSALFLSANPKLVGYQWRDIDNQGFGALNAQAAFKKLKSGDLKLEYPVQVGKLEANVLGKPVKGSVETYQTHTLTLKPSQKFDAVFAISPYTSKVTIEIYDIVAPDNSATAYWPNSLEVHVQSAKRTDVDHPIAVYWYPLLYGDSFTIEIEDGLWTLAGEDWAHQPMEAGLMKVALIGDYSNEAPVKFKMRLVRENNRTPLTNPVAQGEINMGDAFLIPVEIPQGVSQATFDLAWTRDWSKFPSSDLDLVVFDPDFNLVSLGGATLNAPERAVVEYPIAGTWQIYVQGYEMYRPDVFKLFVRTESAPYPVP
jgi:hypothetical protein